MEIDLSKLDGGKVFSLISQSVIPRPVAWVLSENYSGSYNLAPFSYFTPVCSDPPLLVFSVGRKPDRSPKDTWLNIRERKEFVVHVPGREMLAAMNDSSASLPAGMSEVEELGLELENFSGFRLPRLADCTIAMGCDLYEINEVGNGRNALIMGLISRVYLSDRVVDIGENGKIRIDPEKVRPVARLGGPNYAELSTIISLPRPE